MKNNSIEKQAIRKYKRKIFDQIVEPFHPGRALENIFDPEIADIMNNLEKADDNIRKTILSINPDKLLKEVKNNVYKREYLIAISDLSELHDAFVIVNNTLVEFDKHYQDKVHNKFLFEGVKDNSKARERLEKLEQKFSAISHSLIKEAGFLSNFWGRHLSNRGRALGIWEKRFPEKVRTLKEQLNNIINASTQFIQILSDCLDNMSTFRRSRKFEDYEKESLKIRFAFNEYNKTFNTFYYNTAKPLIMQLKAWEEKQTIESMPQKPSEKIIEEVTKPKETKSEEDKSKTTSVPVKYYRDPSTNYLHRVEGPAIEYSNGGGVWYFEGKKIGISTPKDPKTFQVMLDTTKALQKEKDDKIAKLKLLKEQKEQKIKEKIQKQLEESKEKEKASSLPTSLEIGSDVKKAYLNFINDLEKNANQEQSILINKIANFATKIQHVAPSMSLYLVNIIDNLED